MSKQIQKNALSRLPNAAHVEQMSLILQVVSPEKSQELKLETLRKTFANLFNQEDEVFKLNQAYEVTPEVKAVDKERDDMLSFVMGIISSNINNFETSKKDAAAKLDYLTKPYKGINSKSFVQQSALVTNLIQHLKSPAYSPAVTTLDLTQAVEKLAIANERFKTIYVARFDETERRKSLDNMLTVRKKVDEAYYQLTEAINASYLYNSEVVKNAEMEPLLGEVIDKINAIIEMLNQMQSLSGKRKGKEEGKA